MNSSPKMRLLNNLRIKTLVCFVSSTAATSHSPAPTFSRTSTPIRIFSSFSHKGSILIPPTKTHLYASFFCTLIRLYVACGWFCKASRALSSMHGLGFD
ncbi:hypothetical protein HN51_037216 [Arachis hypogaea]